MKLNFDEEALLALTLVLFNIRMLIKTSPLNKYGHVGLMH